MKRYPTQILFLVVVAISMTALSPVFGAPKVLVNKEVSAASYCDTAGSNCGLFPGLPLANGAFANILIMSENECPSGWSRWAPALGRFPIGYALANPGVLANGQPHAHTIGTAQYGGGGTSIAGNQHPGYNYNSATGATAMADPLYVNFSFCKRN